MQPLIKSIRICFFLALILLSMTVYAQDQGIDVTTTAEVSLRTGPGTDWRRISVVPVGTAMRLDGRALSGFWVRGITSGGEIGWVVSSGLSITQAQIDSLRQIWVEEPFTLSPPAGATPPDAPAATAVPPANNPPPVNAAPVRGFSYGGHVSEMGAQAVGHMQRAGMTWVKRQLRNGDDPTWAINQAHANGFQILLGMVGQAGSVMDDGYIAGYVSWLANAAAAGADAIEVWNEPNIPHEWAEGQISPARYTEILRRAYQAIKAANPGTLVISGAPAPTGYFGGCSGNGCDDNRFIAGMAAAGAANYLDCVGVHYNEGVLSPNATSGDPRGSSGYYTRYFWGMINTYTAVFGRSRPLCFTELGYLSPEGFPPLPGSFGWAANVTVAQQAEWLDQAVTLAANSGRVRLLIIWNIDFTQYNADPQAGYAIIRPGGGCPACDALGS